MNHCSICKKTHGLFTLPLETDDGTPYTLHVCGTCWDVIAGISQKLHEPRIHELENKVNRLLAMFPSAAEKQV